MDKYFNLFVLAQSAGDAADKTADQTKEILTKITTWKVTQALIIRSLAKIS